VQTVEPPLAPDLDRRQLGHGCVARAGCIPRLGRSAIRSCAAACGDDRRPNCGRGGHAQFRTRLRRLARICCRRRCAISD
jgi:hypothetical protein